MNDPIIVQYVGFQAKAVVREYVFMVREAGNEPIQYTLTIAHEAFEAHRVSYQDAPSVCSRRLRLELAANANHPLSTSFCVTEAELTEYRDAHKTKPVHGYAAQRKA